MTPIRLNSENMTYFLIFSKVFISKHINDQYLHITASTYLTKTTSYVLQSPPKMHDFLYQTRPGFLKKDCPFLINSSSYLSSSQFRKVAISIMFIFIHIGKMFWHLDLQKNEFYKLQKTFCPHEILTFSCMNYWAVNNNTFF